jgi:hypothetical protein
MTFSCTLRLIEFLASIFLVGVIAAFLVACSDSGAGPTEITVSREISEFERPVSTEATSAQRFQFAQPSGGAGMQQFESSAGQGESSSSAGATGSTGPQLAWDTPEGWTEVPSTSMRDINFTIGSDGLGECYVSRLPSSGGGLVENVNRWRRQMGQEPMSEEEVNALPTREIFNLPASYVAIDGSFTGMGATATIDDARLLGLILNVGNSTLFVKMTGPRDLVTANEDEFDAFSASLRLE